MGRLGIGLAIVVAVALIALALGPRAGRPAIEGPHLVSMADRARALEQAGQAKQTHGQAMLSEAQRSGDRDLAFHGERWRRDGQTLVQRGQWLGMRPLAPGSLLTSPAELLVPAVLVPDRADHAGRLGLAGYGRRGRAVQFLVARMIRPR
jgi:hypothetical protein